VPSVSATAARGMDGKLYASVANLDPREPVDLTLTVAGAAARGASAQMLTAAAMNSHNTFEAPRAVQPVAFDDFEADGDTLTFTLPAKAIVMIAIDE
jgi:alpha-N-arabinofuranosidase